MAVVLPSYTYQSRGVIQTNENYLRISTLLNFAETELYYKVFHDANYGGFPSDPHKLYKHLKVHEIEIQALFNQKVINKDEYNIVFPPNEETYSQEFTTNLFYALSKQCVKKFPPITVDNMGDTPITYLGELGKLQRFSKNETLRDFVNASDEACNQYWNDIITVLNNLGYDVEKLTELKTGCLDEHKKFRLSLIRCEISLLKDECRALMKTVEVNTIALEKLMLNFNAAVTESNDETNSKQSGLNFSNQNGHGENDLKQLKERVHASAEEVSNIMDDIRSLVPILKLWRDKNIEGDIIVLDDRLSKVRNDINEQETTVGDMFTTISLDIVKIKERMSFHGDNSKFVVSSPDLKHRSLLRTDSNRAAANV